MWRFLARSKENYVHGHTVSIRRGASSASVRLPLSMRCATQNVSWRYWPCECTCHGCGPRFQFCLWEDSARCLAWQWSRVPEIRIFRPAWQKRMKRGAGPQGNSAKAAGHPSSSWPFLSPECLPDRLPNAWQGHGNCSPKRCHDLLGCDTSLTCRFAGNQGYRKMSKLAAVVTQAIASGALRFRKCEPSHAPKQM